MPSICAVQVWEAQQREAANPGFSGVTRRGRGNLPRPHILIPTEELGFPGENRRALAMRPAGRMPGSSCTHWLPPGCAPSSASSRKVTRHWGLMGSTGGWGEGGLMLSVGLRLSGCLHGADEESLTVRGNCKSVACVPSPSDHVFVSSTLCVALPWSMQLTLGLQPSPHRPVLII